VTRNGVLQAIGLFGAMAAAAGCGSRPALEEPPPGFGRGPDVIERRCPERVPELWDVVVGTLKDNGFEILHEDHDGVGGEVVAERGGARVITQVRQLDDRESSISVRVEPPDRVVSLKFQEAYARALGRAEACGATEEDTLSISLDRSIRAAEETLQALRIGVLERRRGKDEAVLDGRRGDSVPVRIHLSAGRRTTTATFVAGAAATDETRALADRMRREFRIQAARLAP
jgi:hypothetical protein